MKHDQNTADILPYFGENLVFHIIMPIKIENNNRSYQSCLGSINGEA